MDQENTMLENEYFTKLQRRENSQTISNRYAVAYFFFEFANFVAHHYGFWY